MRHADSNIITNLGRAFLLNGQRGAMHHRRAPLPTPWPDHPGLGPEGGGLIGKGGGFNVHVLWQSRSGRMAFLQHLSLRRQKDLTRRLFDSNNTFVSVTTFINSHNFCGQKFIKFLPFYLV